MRTGKRVPHTSLRRRRKSVGVEGWIVWRTTLLFAETGQLTRRGQGGSLARPMRGKFRVAEGIVSTLRAYCQLFAANAALHG
jgi:hypothetical protein